MASAFPELTSSLRSQDPGLHPPTPPQTRGEVPFADGGAEPGEGVNVKPLACGALLLLHYFPVGGALTSTGLGFLLGI